MPKTPLRSAALLASLLLLGIGPCSTGLPVEIGLPTPAGMLPLAIELRAPSPGSDPTVWLDGVEVTGLFAADGPRLVGEIPLPGPGGASLVVEYLQETAAGLVRRVRIQRPLRSPAAAPARVGYFSARPLPRSTWPSLRFASPPSREALAGWAFGIECDGKRVARTLHALDDGSVVLNPTPELPAGAACRIAWRGSNGAVAEQAFTTSPDAPGAPATVLYDRSDPLALAPFPDDYWTEPDAAQATGLAVDVPTPPFGDPLQARVFQGLAKQVNGVDGWSRQAPIVVALSDPIDESALLPPSTSPLAPVWLVDVDPESPSFRERIPYRLILRSDFRPGGGFDHAALIFPTLDLRAQGRYAVVVRRSAFPPFAWGRPFGPSASFAAVLAPAVAGEPAWVTRARERLAPALAVLCSLPDVPVPVEDIALAFTFTVRSHPPVADLTHIKELALAASPPELVLPDLDVDPCPSFSFCVRLTANRALEVRGRVRLPEFRGPGGVFARDPVTGLPVQTGEREVPMAMTLPFEALDGPVHPVMYQHGNPGSPDEIFSDFTNGPIDDAGLALVAVQDTLNNDIGQDETLQIQAIFFTLIQSQVIPDFWNQTGADMIFFLRAIQGMGELDLLRKNASGGPEIGPDGVPEIDPSVILYKGISEGANNAQRFLPFAPEILAAEATVGGARLAETLIHQSAEQLIGELGFFLPELDPGVLWVGMSLFQGGLDPQDGHSYLRHLYEEPLLPFTGSSDVTPPSTLWTEGIGDSLVPNNATRATAHALGLPHVEPVAEAVPTLETVPAPLASNVAPGITAGYFQYDPRATPSCAAIGDLEGHFCPQSAPEALEQRLRFLLSALDGEAEIVDPF